LCNVLRVNDFLVPENVIPKVLCSLNELLGTTEQSLIREVGGVVGEQVEALHDLFHNQMAVEWDSAQGSHDPIRRSPPLIIGHKLGEIRKFRCRSTRELIRFLSIKNAEDELECFLIVTGIHESSQFTSILGLETKMSVQPRSELSLHFIPTTNTVRTSRARWGRSPDFHIKNLRILETENTQLFLKSLVNFRNLFLYFIMC